MLIGWQREESDEANRCESKDVSNPSEQVALTKLLPDRVGVLSLLRLHDTLINDSHTDSQEHCMELSVGLDHEDLED